jgi:hypothetical protein
MLMVEQANTYKLILILPENYSYGFMGRNLVAAMNSKSAMKRITQVMERWPNGITGGNLRLSNYNHAI